MLRLNVERVVLVELNFFVFCAETATRVKNFCFSGVSPRLLLARSGPRVDVFFNAEQFGSLRQAPGWQLRITITFTELMSWTK
jgi:hypothetical protein